MTSSVFSSTLQSITTAKLSEISKKRGTYETQKTALIKKIAVEQDKLRRLRVLFEGAKRLFVVRTAAKGRGDRCGGPHQIVLGGTKNQQLELMLKSLESFLEQANFDPSISSRQLLDWERQLMGELDIKSRKYKFAELYGDLVTEWLRAKENSTTVDSPGTLDGFEEIERPEKEESRKNWENMVFESHETDTMAISEYLLDLFGENGENKQPFKGLEALWRSVKVFEASLAAPNQFNEHVLKWTISGLLASGLLSDEKRAVLRDFISSSVILAEIADVLNLRLLDISSWSWERTVAVEMRRHITGAWHIYIDEELLEAIFFQFTGVKWSIFFKEAFSNFTNYEGAWASLRPQIPSHELKRREYYLGAQIKNGSLQSKRQAIWKSNFFMSQLSDSPYQESAAIDGEEEVRYDLQPVKRQRMDDIPTSQHMMQQSMSGVSVPQQQQQQFAQQIACQQQATMQQRSQMAVQAMPQGLPRQPHHYIPVSYNSPPPISNPGSILQPHNNDEFDLDPFSSKPKSTMATKQFLLHLMSTEMLINTKLHGDFTVARSELSSFFPTLPHSTILSVFRFFGVSKKWLGFFKTFLEAPLKFPSDSEPRLRKRGVPGAHALSTFCGEAILFCLDYTVNQSTNGAQLFRMHDDFWVWDKDQTVVAKGWKAITTFTNTMGLSLNTKRTGTVRILSPPHNHLVPRFDADLSPALPRGQIRWGFLLLDPITGKWGIDQNIVDTHISSLSYQLKSKENSIFAWIQAWNTYASTFFATNFGRPSNIFGRDHVDQLLSTLTRVQKSLFGESQNVVTHLKGMIAARFDITKEEIPDGFLYLPTHLGGLGLNNPFIKLVSMRNKVFEAPELVLDEFLETEKEVYRRAKSAWDSGKTNRKMPDPTCKEYFSFEEFTRYREDFAAGYRGDLRATYFELLAQPGNGGSQIEVCGGEGGPLGLKSLREAGMGEEEMRWIAGLYGQEIVDAFGGLEIVEGGLLPMGMVNLFKSGKVTWEG